jgi:ParB family chromosome partitioning protein
VLPKHGLGKGLGALLPLVEEGSQTVNLPLEKLQANPNQPRRYFDEASLRELADSIQEHGIIQPIIAEETGDGTYCIVAGERRTRAAALAGLSTIPALIRHYTDEKRMEVSLIENIQRADLNPIEEASAYKGLMELTGLSQDEIAAKVGKNRSTVANALRLLKLPRTMQERLEQGALSAGHARALLSVSNPQDQEHLFQEMLTKGISVREAEKRATAFNTEGNTKIATKVSSVPKQVPELRAIEEKFIESLGTKVSIEGDLHKGSIHIEYYSMEDLDRLYEILGR